MLELIVNANTDDIVRAAVDSLGGDSGLFLGVVAIDSAEIAYVQANLVSQIHSTSKANAIAVAGERSVLLVFVAQTIVGALATAANGELIVDIKLYAGKEFVG